MTKPTTLPTWDSTQTHVVPITAGHASTGFVNNEVPGSGELNALFNLQGQWITWLNSVQEPDITTTIPIRGFENSTGDPSTLIGPTGFGVSHWMVPVPVPVGATIKSVRARVSDAVGSTIQVSLVRYTTVVAAVATATSNGSGTLQTLTMSPLSEVVADLTTYSAVASLATGTSDCSWIHLSMTYSPIQPT